MTARELLSDLTRRDVHLWVEDDRLRYSAPPGVMTDALLQLLKAHKAELIGRLREVDGGGVSPMSLEALGPRPEELPLSYAQQRLWIVEQMEPGTGAYNVGGALGLEGPLDLPALAAGLREVGARHDVLRTSVGARNGRPFQVVADSVVLPLPVADLSTLPAERRRSEMERQADRQAGQGFDLSRQPLMRTLLLRLDREDHALVLTMHHVISDGRSIDILTRELAALYLESAQGVPARLPELPVQYPEYARWQRASLPREELDRQLDYWRQRLAGSPPLLDLPTDRPRPEVRSPAGADEWFRVPAETLEGLRRLGAEVGTTLYMTLLAGYQALLSRYSAQDDVLVGTPLAGRSRPELEGLIGCFVNTVVMRTGTAGRPTVVELLRRVRATALGAYDHQDVPFDRLVEELSPQRSLGHHPMFQVWFVFDHATREATGLGPLTVRAIRADKGRSKFDLHLAIDEAGDGLVCRLAYSTDLFDATTIRRMGAHLRALLEGMASAPDAPVLELPLLTASERHQQLLEWNPPSGHGAWERCFHDLFGERAARVPEALAVACGEDGLSYGELERRANRLARHLRSLGVGPDVRVGLCLERSVDLIEGLLGILKAGGAFVPLDPQAPEERLRFQVADSGAHVMVTEERLLRRLGEPPGSAVCLDRDRGELDSYDPAHPAIRVDPEHLAYVIYTSGSTGRPKGVAVEHGQLSAYVGDVTRRLDLATGSRFATVTTIAADLGHTMVFPALALGGCLHLVTERLATDAAAFGRYLQTRRIDHLKIVPSHLAALWRAAGVDRVLPARSLILGGEASPWGWIREVGSQLGTCTLFNHYGPTETTVGVLTHRVVPVASPPGTKSVPLGRPLRGAQVHVLGADLRPVPPGASGELCVAGRGLARGYLGRPGLTAGSFVPSPWGGAGSRLYRTGDRARHLGDGRLEFLGRLDQQIKVRGYRVEPGEVESVLDRHAGVGQSAVVLREDAPGEGRLVGYVVGRDGAAAPSGDELRAHLRSRLPEYMVPSAFVCLEELPLTPNGKLDRAALPAPESAGRGSGGAVAPGSAAERALASIWEEVLGVEGVGVEDNFFELGGDSILCIQVIARAREAGYRLTLQQVFRSPTIAALARLAEAAGDVAAAASAGPERARGPVPLTPIQRWFFAQEPPEPHHFNQSVLLALRERVEPWALERAVSAVMAHHDALRLRFERDGEGWRQVPPDGEAPEGVYARVDLSRLEARGAALEAVAARVQRSLDLERGPLVRVVHFDLGSDGERLLLVIHHLVVDGVSWRVLLEDLRRAREQIAEGRSVELPPKSTPFQEWARRLKEYARSEALASEAAYWTDPSERGVAAPPAGLSGDPGTVASARSVSVRLDRERTRQLLQEVPAAYRTQINDVLLAALGRALEGWTGSSRVVVELEGHGREELFEDVDLSRSVGWFTTLYPVELDLSGCAGPGEALKAVKERLQGVPRRGVGHGVLCWLGPEEVARALRDQPRPPVRFNYLGQVDQVVSEAGPFADAPESAGPSRSRAGRLPYPLDVSGVVAGGELRLDWTYSELVHRRETVEAVATSYLAALDELIEHCLSLGARGYTPADFPLAGLEQEEIDRCLQGVPDVEDVYPLSPLQQGLLFHTLFTARPGVYFEQLSCRIETGLDTGAFRGAWERVVARHPVLRTSFLWEDLERPVQVVWRGAAPDWIEEDWRTVPETERAQRVAEFLEADRERGFDLSTPPMRLGLLRVEESAYHFVWSYHHLLLDGWSSSAIVSEVFLAYADLCRGREPRSEMPRPYRDYIAWLQEQDLGEAEAFWRRSLDGFAAPTRLWVERTTASPAGEAPAYREEELLLSGETTEALRELARRNGLTLNTAVQGALGLLLSRYSGEEDVLFGATVAGRPAELPGVESMRGLFINTLPVRVRTDAGQALPEYLRDLQAQQAEARRYEYSPLMDVQSWSEVPRGLPLFDTLFVFENYPIDRSMEEEAAQSLRIASVHNHDWTHYGLTVEAAPGSTSLRVSLRYDPLRFEAPTMTGMCRHLGRLLEGMVAAPQARLGDLRLLTDEERRRLLVEWSSTAAPYPETACVHELIDEQVERTPDATAVIDRHGVVSYRALADRAERLAAGLAARGVGRGSVVAVAAERGGGMLALLLAILKAGGAYLPLDPWHPPGRNALILEAARVDLVVAGRGSEERATAASGERCRVVVLEDLEGEAVAAPPPRHGTGPQDLAYVIYTSGSTGAPKGAMVEHRGLLNHLLAKVEDLGLGPVETVAQSASHCFDISVWQFFSALVLGGTTRIVADEIAHDPERLLEAVEATGISILEVVPSVLRGMLESLAGGPHPGPRLPALRWLIATGEALAPELCREWLERYPEIPVMNAYGPTECSDDVSHAVIARAPESGPASVPIGRAVRNIRLYVLDRGLEPLPAGIAGELAVGGDGVGRGYLNAPAKTARAFVPDPFGSSRGARLYRTGDLARHLPHGEIEFLGRIDHQVKLRGFRIELGEIESTLSRHPEVSQAVALVREAEGGTGEAYLVAYVVGREGRVPGSEELRSFVAAELPDYMVPSAFVELESVPLTANGKVDRKALPATAGQVRDREIVAPRDVVEEAVARIWGDILGLDRVGVRDPFFDLGGHSLLATRIVSLVRRTFQTELPLRTLFEGGTVEAMARTLEAGESTPGLTRAIAEMALDVVEMDEEAVGEQLQAAEMGVQS